MLYPRRARGRSEHGAGWPAGIIVTPICVAKIATDLPFEDGAVLGSVGAW